MEEAKGLFSKRLCLFGIIIINHYYASYITVNVPQQISLLKLVCRFRPHLLFKQIHLYGKLFIYEVYRRACGRGLYFPSIRVELYKKYTKRRMLPYFSQHIWKVAVTEYMTFLCYTGVLRKVGTYKYQKIRGIVMVKQRRKL